MKKQLSGVLLTDTHSPCLSFQSGKTNHDQLGAARVARERRDGNWQQIPAFLRALFLSDQCLKNLSTFCRCNGTLTPPRGETASFEPIGHQRKAWPQSSRHANCQCQWLARSDCLNTLLGTRYSASWRGIDHRLSDQIHLAAFDLRQISFNFDLRRPCCRSGSNFTHRDASSLPLESQDNRETWSFWKK